MDSSSPSSHSPSFSNFQLPHPHPCPHSYSQSYPTVPVSDMPLETYLPRCVLRGSLDPTTGIFYRAPEHTRIRTAQACDKCRVRKAKCSGDHPVCERCHTRGLTCRYAPERRTRRWSKAKAEQDAVPDRSAGRSGFVPQSPDALQPARPQSGPWGTSTSHGPSSRDADMNRPRSGSEDGQCTGGTAPRTRPRRATIASTKVHPLSSSSISQQVFDLRRGGPDRPRQGCGHPVSGCSSIPVRANVAHEALETTEESMVCGGGDGERTLEGDPDLDLDTPRVGQNALALCLDPYTDDPPVFIESILTPEATGDDVSRVTLADRDPAYTNLGLTGAEHPEGVDGAQHPVPFHDVPHSHQSRPGPGSCFDMSSVDLGTLISDDGRPPLCCASNVESPGRTPLTSSSASSVLTRARSDELPMTPTNSYPNSPVVLTSLSPHLGFIGNPDLRPPIASEMWTVDTGTDGHRYHHHGDGDGMLTGHVGWREVKDSTHSFWGDLGLFIDMDAVF